MTTMCENMHGATMRAQSPETSAVAAQILKAYAIEMHIDDVENNAYIVNSSELAVHSRAL